MNAKELAVLFHETYERLAPQFGYETREETRQFDETSKNGRLMVAVCGEILGHLTKREPDSLQAGAILPAVVIVSKSNLPA